MELHAARIETIFEPVVGATLIRVESPALAGRIQPGQFVMARRAGTGWDPMLGRPLLVAGFDPDEGVVTLWVPGGEEERDRIRALPPGARLELLGPLGSGFAERRAWRHLLLVAEGLALGALLAVMQRAVAAGRSVALLSVLPEGHEPYPPDALPLSIEYQRAPRGGAGIAAQEMLRWADGLVAAGSQRFYQDLVDEIRTARPGQRGGVAFGLMLEPFGWDPDRLAWGPAAVACAVAACRACLVPLRRDRRLACTSGPTFDLWEL